MKGIMMYKKYVHVCQIGEKYAILLKNYDFHKFNSVNMNKSPEQIRTTCNDPRFTSRIL